MTASYRALGDAAIHPNACMGFSARQLGAERVWGASAADVVPQPLDEDAPIEWSPIWSLTRGEHRYLPTSYLYFSYPIRPETFFAWADSNGNAAGNTLEEAILQGFMELVERDAVAIWWYNRLRRPGLDLASFDEPYLLELHDRYARLQRELWLLDLTSDLGIPTFGAFSRRIDKPAEDIIFGFGAHLDPKIAALRAVTEMNQFLPAVLPIQADGSGDYAMYDPNCRQWWQSATIENQPYLAPDPLAPVTSARAIPQAWTADVAEDVRLCQRLVEARGLEMLVLDQTRPDIGLPVAKVIVPGLRHFWPRLGSGRLYDVPVEMGWRDRPLTEDELNPLAMFL
jgi:ribosomal protein S12 methylthiotransferase accessory factor